MREKITEALLLIIAMAVVSKLVFNLLGPMLPTLIAVSYVFYFFLRRR